MITEWPIIVEYNAPTPVGVPIGQIAYLGNNGRVYDTIEYACPVAFAKTIADDSYHGVPAQIILYTGKDGQVIAKNYFAALTASRYRVRYVPSPYLEKSFLDVAKEHIEAYLREEFGQDSKGDFSDLSAIPVAYTTNEDDTHDIQAYVDLENLQIVTQANKETIRIEKYPSLWVMTQVGLRNLAFDDLTYVPDDFYKKAV